MPYLKISATKNITQDQEETLVKALGEAIRKIPGKDPKELDVEIDSGKTIYRGGIKQENFVYIDVRYLRNYKFHIKRELTIALFDAIHEVLDTAEDKMCLSIFEFHTWGGFGDFIDEFYTENI